MLDFAPCVAFGDGVSVPASSTGYVILYPLPDFDVGDAEFLVEDAEETGLFLERIVGDILLSFADAGSAAVAWSLLPMGANYASLQVLEPYTIDWNVNSSEWANVRFWDRRIYELETTVNTPLTVDHPYWTQVDIKPRTLCGSSRNLWPVLAVQNFHPTVALRVQHHLRALWK